MDFGDWMKARRKKLGLTQTQLADRCYMSKARICELETHVRYNPSLSVASAITEALGVPLWKVLKHIEI